MPFYLAIPSYPLAGALLFGRQLDKERKEFVLSLNPRIGAKLSRSAVAFALTASLLASPASALAVTRAEVIDRASEWSAKRVPYSQSRYHEGYRTDCSGYVSMAWGLPDSLTTWTIPRVAKRIGKGELKPGDVLLNNDGGALRHVVIFGGWANAEKTSYIGYEENGPLGRAVRRVIPYPFFFAKSKFKPWRFTGITEGGPAVAGPVAAAAPAAPVTPPGRYIDSLRGADHYLTAVRTSKRSFKKADTVVVASGENQADALVAASLAGASDAPLLLVGPKKLHAEVAAEIRRLGAREILIVGSHAAVSPQVGEELKRIAPVGRLTGVDRFQTAQVVAKETVRRLEANPEKDYDGSVLIVSANRPEDALAATPLAASKGWPLLFSGRDDLTPATRATIRGKGLTRAVILGSGSAVRPNVAAELAKLTGSPVERLGGSDPYAASAAIAAYAAKNGHDMKNAAIVTNASHTDAIAAGVAQGADGSVLLVTRRDQLSTPVSRTLGEKAKGMGKVRVIGGTMQGQVRDAIVKKLSAKDAK